MNRLIVLCAVLFLFYSSEVANSSDCSEKKDSISIVQCHEQRYLNADREMNKVYSEAIKTLPDGERQKLKEAQKAWLKYRDASFEFCIEQNKETRSYGSIAVADYKATLVEKRVRELKFLLSNPEDPPVKW